MTAPAKLYAVMIRASWGSDFLCTLVAETGEVLHEHISSTKSWGRRDLEGGLKHKHTVATKFPDGYEIVAVDRWSDVPEQVLDAYRALATERERGATAAPEADPIETPPPSEHLVAKATERGFDHYPAIPGAYGGEATAYESSAASGPHVWLKVTDSPLHLTAENATKLAEQLVSLVANHYQNEAGK